MIDSTASRCSDPWQVHSAHVVQVTPETPGVATYHVQFDDVATGQSFRFAPGQFNMLYLPGLGEIAISISGSPHVEGPVPHTIRSAGSVTQTLADLGQGAAIGIRGPFGSSWPLSECAGRDIVLVAGGIGLAPLRSVILHVIRYREQYRSVTVLCGARSSSGLLYTGEHEFWRAHDVAVNTTVDRATGDWSGNVGVVTLLLDRMSLPSPGNTVLMTCGPELMMWYTIQSALRRGVPRESIWMSMERNMNCAIGLCGHCQFGPQFICKDGPVLRYDRVEPYLRVDDL